MKINAGTSGIAQIIAGKKVKKSDKVNLKVASKVYASSCCQNQY